LTADVIHFDGLGVQETFQVVQYEALSYTWGQPDLVFPIECNGLLCHVTPNLGAALRPLRYPDKHRYLWADCLCINQDDDKEKAAQIGILFTIFHKADRVVAWLGEELERTCLAFALLRFGRRDKIMLFKHDDECLPRLTKAYEAFREVHSRPWFGRTWIRQEGFAARRIVIRCGALEIDFREFFNISWAHAWISRALYLYREGRKDDADAQFAKMSELMEILLRGGADFWDAKARFRRDTHILNDTATQVLYKVLEVGTYFEVTDPRDFVYGILGTVSNIDCLHRAGIYRCTPISRFGFQTNTEKL
jgi:hypothetical protein